MNRTIFNAIFLLLVPTFHAGLNNIFTSGRNCLSIYLSIVN